MTRLSLLIDADDTLWENNIYFERAFDVFCDFLAHSALTPPQEERSRPRDEWAHLTERRCQVDVEDAGRAAVADLYE